MKNALYCSDIHFLFPYHMYMHAIIVGRDADEKQIFVAQMKNFIFKTQWKWIMRVNLDSMEQICYWGTGTIHSGWK